MQDLPGQKSLIELFPSEWEPVLQDLCEPTYRGVQIFHWIHKRGVFDPEQMTDLPKEFREQLSIRGLAAPLTIVETKVSSDATQKLLLEMRDGRRVESVLIPNSTLSNADLFAPSDMRELFDLSSDSSCRVTQCVSSQVGCAMGCRFCASGKVGLLRQMNADEIVSQVLVGRSALKDDDRLSGIVFMGIGEPLHNYKALARAISLLSHPEGQGISLRRMTVSTCGLVPEIERLAIDFGGQVQLAVSLHAADDETRSKIMPINRKYPIGDVVNAIRRYPTTIHDRITVEYVLIRGINDSERDALRLVDLLRNARVKVNLIPMNTIPGTSFFPSPEETVEAFYHALRRAGIMVFVRRRRGDDIAAACGQLALRVS
jgi:23S rRNA (adenine2503-C2)-methyltransferase